MKDDKEEKKRRRLFMLVKVAIRETEIPKRTLPMVSQCDGPSKTGDLYVEPKAIHSSNVFFYTSLFLMFCVFAH